MELKKLSLPFPEAEIEWRISQAGKNQKNVVWAQCLAYVQARAIMNRLDEVVGPENWRDEYQFVAAQGIAGGVLCGISIRIGDEWVTKWDGAEQTDIESFKGGISSALKRAAVHWGIGRYLYDLETGYAQIVADRNSGGRWAKLKDNTEYYWVPPNLPAWALPDPSKARGSGRITPEQPGPEMGYGAVDDQYRIDFGQWNRLTLAHVFKTQGKEKIVKYIDYLERSATEKGVQLTQPAVRFISEAEKFLADVENGHVMTA